jgi:hypothetical protein
MLFLLELAHVAHEYLSLLNRLMPSTTYLRFEMHGLFHIVIGFDLARAVVPPPRLQSKWVFFSAVLRSAERNHGWVL